MLRRQSRNGQAQAENTPACGLSHLDYRRPRNWQHVPWRPLVRCFSPTAMISLPFLFALLPDFYQVIRCCIATQQLLHRDKAIAASPCSNQLCSISLAKRQMKRDDEEGNVNNLSFGCCDFMGVKEVKEVSSLCSLGEVKGQ